MVLLTVTPATKAAAEEYCRVRMSHHDGGDSEDDKIVKLSNIEIGSPLDHNDLSDISRFLVDFNRQDNDNGVANEWRLDTLLKGANVYQPPPPPKPEQVCILAKAPCSNIWLI